MELWKGFAFNFYILDPVGLFGEGAFNINNIKEISVTDSFMGLDRDTRNCQNIETYDDCKTRLHIEHLRQECRCLPLSLRLSEKVKKIINKYVYKNMYKYTGYFVHVKQRNWV